MYIYLWPRVQNRYPRIINYLNNLCSRMQGERMNVSVTTGKKSYHNIHGVHG
jgi:hypothetical protein